MGLLPACMFVSLVPMEVRRPPCLDPVKLGLQRF